MEGHLPNEEVPYVWADFNACGWAGDGDASYYALDGSALAAIPATEGARVFLWCHDDAGTILGCVAILQHVTLGAFRGWRAQPVPDSFYRGPVPADLPAWP